MLLNISAKELSIIKTSLHQKIVTHSEQSSQFVYYTLIHTVVHQCQMNYITSPDQLGRL